MVSVCESKIIFRPASVHLSVISSLTTGCTFTKLAARLPLMVRVCESKIILPSICPFPFQCLSVRHTIWILLKHWAEFNQTCYMNFLHCKGVQEQYVSVQRSSVWCPYICPSHYFLSKQWAEFNQTCNYWISLPFMVRVCESKSIHQSICPSVMLLATLGWMRGSGVGLGERGGAVLLRWHAIDCAF